MSPLPQHCDELYSTVVKPLFDTPEYKTMRDNELAAIVKYRESLPPECRDGFNQIVDTITENNADKLIQVFSAGYNKGRKSVS